MYFLKNVFLNNDDIRTINPTTSAIIVLTYWNEQDIILPSICCQTEASRHQVLYALFYKKNHHNMLYSPNRARISPICRTCLNRCLPTESS